jgi:hypothetical protein
VCSSDLPLYRDDHDPDPARRYKKFWIDYSAPFDPEKHGVYAGYSADGVSVTVRVTFDVNAYPVVISPRITEVSPITTRYPSMLGALIRQSMAREPIATFALLERVVGSFTTALKTVSVSTMAPPPIFEGAKEGLPVTITGADIDGDGRLDLVMALYSSNTVKWYVGWGLVDGPFGRAPIRRARHPT